MAKLIGTAGHIDHGKTTLIRALTGIDADRLPEEKARGMTIDIGFAFVDLPGHGRVSIVDVPGHERFLRNMLVGALGIDVALLCVAADESVKPQTIEHLQILDLLPVEKLVVALTRSDLVDAERELIAKMEAEELIGSTRFRGSPVVPISSVTGRGLEQLKQELSRALDYAPDETSDGQWYLPIDRAFTVKGHGCVVTGTLARGIVKVGDQAVMEPGGRPVRIRAIHTHGTPTETSDRGRRTALNLAGVKLEEVYRGMAIGAPGNLFETQAIDAAMRWLAPIKRGDRVRVSIGSEEVIGRAVPSQDGSTVQFRLEAKIACALHQPFIVRRYSPPDLLGGGKVLVPQAIAGGSQASPSVIVAETEEEAVLKAIGDDFAGTETEEVCRKLGKTPQALGNTFERLSDAGTIKGFAGLWFKTQSLALAIEKVVQSLRRLHEDNPAQAYVQRDKVVAAAGLKWTGKPLDRIVAHLAATQQLEVSGTGVKLPEFRVQLTPRQREFLDRVAVELHAMPVNTPSVHQMAQSLNAPPQAVDEILKLGAQAGEIVSLGDGVYYSPAQLADIRRRLAAHFSGKPFPASAVRDALSTTRKYAIPILEYFDRIRFTVRIGDQRMINEERL